MTPQKTSPYLLPAVFLIAAAVLIGRAILMPATPLFADTDDAMRLVVVRDFLAGQPWYDLVQHRLDTPFGAEIHWSRLVDVPIATLLLIFTPLLGAAGATLATAYVWPLFLLFCLLWLSAKLAQRLLGPEGVLPALVLPLLSPALTTEFSPGRLDHHSVEILLTLALVWTSIEALSRPRFAWIAGLLCAAAVTVATESIPAIAAAIVVFAMMWVIDPRRLAQLRGFGLSFALFAMIGLALTRLPNRWLEPACDMISPVYVGGALVVAVACIVVSLLPTPKSAWLRLLILGGLGALGLAALLRAYPQCLDGPYGAVDPWLRRNWLSNIAEAKPWATSVIELPAFALGAGLPVLFGLLVIIVKLLRDPADRGPWLVLLAFLGFAATIMLLQIRGARLALMPAVPAAAWLILLARQHYLQRQRLGRAVFLAIAWFAFAGSGITLLVEGIAKLQSLPALATAAAGAAASVAPPGDRRACLLPSAFADLAALPPERIMTPIDLGSHMLMQTPHSVVSAPYHRDGDGVRDTFDFINQPIDQARTILERRGIGLVVTCPEMAEMKGFPDRAPDSFAALAERNALPAWLHDVSLGGPLKIYAVLPR